MFKVGDKVRCVTLRDNLNKTTVYTIKETFIGVSGELIVTLKEVKNTSYYSERFVHVDEDYFGITPVIRKIREMEQRRASYAAI